MPVLRIISLLVTLLVYSTFTIAQSDPDAQVLLDKMYQKYQSAQAVSANFDLILELPESGEEVQKGMMIQKGERYKVKLEAYTVYNNGSNMWMYLAEANECQLTNANSEDEESEVPNLNDILSMYKSEEFDYRIVDDGSVMGKASEIEFKPKDIDSEFFKMVLILDNQKNTPRSIQFFHKDGSRYTIDITSIDFDKAIADDTFTFNPTDYPDVYIEDLRLD